MSLSFDFSTVQVTEFGVCREGSDGEDIRLVPVDAEVQQALVEMAQATWRRMQALSQAPQAYQPSEKHESHEHLFLKLDDPMAARMRQIQTAENLPMDGHAMSNPGEIVSYLSRMTDGRGRRLTALRRATQFKGVLKSRLLRFVSDAMRFVADDVFKLDADFDLLIDGTQVHILRPSGFEFAGRLQEAILAAAPENIQAIKRDLPFVEFSTIEQYASKHPRAARYLASIRAQRTRNISQTALKKLCRDTGVQITVAKGAITVPPEEVLGFLEVLDRRRYELELIDGAPERYRAGSRQKIDP